MRHTYANCVGIKGIGNYFMETNGAPSTRFMSSTSLIDDHGNWPGRGEGSAFLRSSETSRVATTKGRAPLPAKSPSENHGRDTRMHPGMTAGMHQTG